ncbi:MAG: hypothetical protein PUC70_05785 [bacterium]|nr:hypothetical protein [bacterium]
MKNKQKMKYEFLLELINNLSVCYDQLVIDSKISHRTVSRVFVSLV